MKVEIDLNMLRDCGEKLSGEDILHDIKDVYCLQGVYNDERTYRDLAEEIYYDYYENKTNYRAYIQKGMHLRMFIELRKTVMLVTDDLDLYRECIGAETPEEIKERRIKYFHRTLCDEYDDIDCRYYIVSNYLVDRDRRVHGYDFCLEWALEDGDDENNGYKGPVEYIRQALNYILPPSLRPHIDNALMLLGLVR